MANMVTLAAIHDPTNAFKLPVLSNQAEWKLFFDYLPKLYS